MRPPCGWLGRSKTLLVDIGTCDVFEAAVKFTDNEHDDNIVLLLVAEGNVERGEPRLAGVLRASEKIKD